MKKIHGKMLSQYIFDMR